MVNFTGWLLVRRDDGLFCERRASIVIDIGMINNSTSSSRRHLSYGSAGDLVMDLLAGDV